MILNIGHEAKIKASRVIKSVIRVSIDRRGTPHNKGTNKQVFFAKKNCGNLGYIS